MTKKVLFVTSISPHKSAGLAIDYISVLENLGYSVDILTKYKEKDLKNRVISAYDYFEPEAKQHLSLAQRIKKRFPFLSKLHNPSYYFYRKKVSTYSYLINEKEDMPPVPSELFLHKLEEKYDFAMVLFWHFMFSSKSIGDIYQKLKAPIFLCVADMIPMTGGCTYVNNCKNFLEHCGFCPVLGKQRYEDQTFINYSYKHKVYNSSDVVFLGNTWLNEFAKKAKLFQNVPVRQLLCITNEDFFNIKDKKQSRNCFGISDNCFLMFVGAVNLNLERKGFKYLISAVNEFSKKVNMENKQILLMTAGQNHQEYYDYFHINIKQVGFLSASELSIAYSASDVFLCPSIED
ncbi:MAG: hypothetical protein LBG92_02955, partial [Prevotellaceae bacterium]|nr:hypothetical protein [Prevotellaceae bacterium]